MGAVPDLKKTTGCQFGPSKVTKCLENALFRDQKWVKTGAKMHFPKNNRGPFRQQKDLKCAYFEQIWPPKSERPMKMGHFGTTSGSKMGQNKPKKFIVSC